MIAAEGCVVAFGHARQAATGLTVLDPRAVRHRLVGANTPSFDEPLVGKVRPAPKDTARAFHHPIDRPHTDRVVALHELLHAQALQGGALGGDGSLAFDVSYGGEGPAGSKEGG